MKPDLEAIRKRLAEASRDCAGLSDDEVLRVMLSRVVFQDHARTDVEELLAWGEGLERELEKPCSDCESVQPCGHHQIHEKSVSGVDANGMEQCADWCRVCEEEIEPLKRERDDALAKVAELEALMHFDARRPDGRGVGPDDIKAYLDQTEWEWLTVVQQVRGRLMAFEDFQKRAEQAEAEVERFKRLGDADLCYLSRVFNAQDDLRSERGRRINEWLGYMISEACSDG